MESKKNIKKSTISIRKLAMAGVLVAVAVAGSLISFPVAGSKCAPIQHMVNICAAVFLGPVWGVGVAFCASVIRNLTGLGSLMAFPGSMVGALCCGLMYRFSKKIIPTCVAEALGTGILGGLAAYPLAKYVMLIQPEGMFIYIVPFLISTVAGSIVAAIVMLILKKNGALAQYREMEVFTQFASDLDDATKAQLAHGKALMELLKQPLCHPLSLHEQVMTLIMANNGVFDTIETKEVKKYQGDILSYMDLSYPEIGQKIEENRAIDEELVNKIMDAVKEYKG